MPEDLEALCPSCHKKADGERKAAWAKQWAKWEDERAEERDWNRFNGWMKARHDENWSDHLSSDEVAEEREKFREMCARKREEKENQ